jgi:hypothetical protein
MRSGIWGLRFRPSRPRCFSNHGFKGSGFKGSEVQDTKVQRLKTLIYGFAGK